MNTVLKNITFLSLFLVGLAILSHSTIPHDHHYDLGAELEHNHHHDEDSNEEPMHCHFLNHIDLDKVTTNSLHQVLKQVPILYALLIDVNFDKNKNSNPEINQQNNTRFSNLKVLLRVSPTRGSPLLSL